MMVDGTQLLLKKVVNEMPSFDLLSMCLAWKLEGGELGVCIYIERLDTFGEARGGKFWGQGWVEVDCGGKRGGKRVADWDWCRGQ